MPAQGDATYIFNFPLETETLSQARHKTQPEKWEMGNGKWEIIL